MLGTFLKGASAAASDLNLIVGQTQDNYNGSGGNGTFSGGSMYSNGNTIELSNGATITVTFARAFDGQIFSFVVSTTGPAESGVTLTQASTTGGGSGFTLTPGPNNLE